MLTTDVSVRMSGPGPETPPGPAARTPVSAMYILNPSPVLNFRGCDGSTRSQQVVTIPEASSQVRGSARSSQQVSSNSPLPSATADRHLSTPGATSSGAFSVTKRS